MKLTCLQENLNRGLSIVGRVAATRTTLPITSNVLLATDEGRLKLASTNLEMAISSWIGAQVAEEGSITIPARLLGEYVASLPAEKMELELVGKQALHIKCDRFEARISGIEAQDFPPIPRVEGEIVTQIDPEDLREAIGQVIFAAASDESRPVLTGVNLEFEGPELTMAAADGFRLAVRKLPLSTPTTSEAVAIVPGRALVELSRLLAQEQEPVEVALDSERGQIQFRLKSAELTSQLILGNFPRYKQLIPQKTDTYVVVDTPQLLRAVKTAAIFARDGGGIVRISVSGGDTPSGKLLVSARSEEVGDNVGEVDAAVQGKEAKIAFNGRYLVDVLSVIREPQVSLGINSPSSPGVIRPVGTDNYVHVIMPMYVSW